MARRHEEFLAELFGGRKSRGSGSQWQDQGDGRNNRMTDPEFAFAWDGKSTRGKGITIERTMIAKIREQAGGERPALALRWYDTDDLKVIGEDWVAVPAADFAEMLAGARLAITAEQSLNEAARISAGARDVIAAHVPGPDEAAAELQRFTPPPRPALSGPYPDDLPPPLPVMWPCLVVDGRHVDEGSGPRMRSRGYWIGEDGTVTERGVSSVRYDRGMGELRLYVNEVRVLCGELYADGQLRVRVGAPEVPIG